MESIADSFIEAVVEETKKVRLGDPMDGKKIGPMALIQLENRSKEQAKQEGRTIVWWESSCWILTGYFFQPTVFDKVESEMTMMNVETFGPIIPIQKIKTLDEAIELANNSTGGLGCNIYTNDMGKALQLQMISKLVHSDK